MLIEFSVKNFRSIKERQTLSLVSSNSNELRATNTMPVLNGKQALVRSAVIYGPNASGKTNIFKALKAMEEIVLHSAQQQRGDELPITPYLFDSATRELPTEFEVMLISDGIRYQYGFAATRQRIVEEWLFAYPKGRAQSWIDRKYDPDSDKYVWGKTEKLIGPKQLWQSATRSNSLFLSTAIQLNNSQLQPIFDWFGSVVRFLGIGKISPMFTIEYSSTAKGKRDVLDLLQNADFAIQDVEIKRERFRPEHLPNNGSEIVPQEILEILKDAERIDTQTLHLGHEGESFILDMEEESDGTQKFFALAGPWLDILKHGWVVVVDELNDNLHPLLVKHLIQMFHDTRLNHKNAQLIFTTHETSILSQEVFRRDQVWFTEKDEYNATTLYPLSDFSPRKGVENLEKSYLQGRYGALPYFRDIRQRMMSTHG